MQVTTGSVSGAQEIEAPTITSDTEVEFHVNLKKPGDFYEFTIEARNDGTIDAMINSVSKKLNGTEITTLPAYLDYTVTYEDDIEIQDNHLLAAESLETYKIRVEYKSNISASDLPSTAQSLSLSFGVEYVQSDENAATVRQILYSTLNDGYLYIGREYDDNMILYETPEAAMEAMHDTPIFLKHILVNDSIIKTYIGFVYNDNTYYLQGAGASFNAFTNEYNNDSIYYEKNKLVLQNVFGDDNCYESGNSYQCINPSYSLDDVYAYISAKGHVEIGVIYTCVIDRQGRSSCGKQQ